MNNKKVIHPDCLPTKPPLFGTAVTMLVLDRLHAAQWVWGVAVTLLTLLWIGSIIALVREQWVRPQGFEKKAD